MTKRSDMASRYAAAHARRDQRRRQGAGRDFLPLAEHADDHISGARTFGSERSGGVATAAVEYRGPRVDYSYLRHDLIRTALLAVVLFAVMVVLSLVIHV